MTRRKTRATIEVHHFFSKVSHSRSLRHVLLNLKIDLESKKTATIPDEKTPIGLGIQREKSCKKMAYYFSFRRVWLKEPRHSESISYEKRYLYRSMRRKKESAFEPDEQSHGLRCTNSTKSTGKKMMKFR